MLNFGMKIIEIVIFWKLYIAKVELETSLLIWPRSSSNVDLIYDCSRLSRDYSDAVFLQQRGYWKHQSGVAWLEEITSKDTITTKLKYSTSR